MSCKVAYIETSGNEKSFETAGPWLTLSDEMNKQEAMASMEQQSDISFLYGIINTWQTDEPHCNLVYMAQQKLPLQRTQASFTRIAAWNIYNEVALCNIYFIKIPFNLWSLVRKFSFQVFITSEILICSEITSWIYCRPPDLSLAWILEYLIYELFIRYCEKSHFSEKDIIYAFTKSLQILQKFVQNQFA